MAYESESFREHHLTRLPTLRSLLELGWSRDQIQCPSPESNDTEWRVPKTPSESSRREKGHGYNGFPVDMAIFDSVEGRGDWKHCKIIIECKEPSESSGISELETYMGLEPKVRMGIWTDGARITRVYKLPSGEFRVETGSTLPRPDENLILSENVGSSDLSVPTYEQLSCCFMDLLGLTVSSDGRSTRSDARLNQLCNILLIKLQSDSDARMLGSKKVDFQILDTPEETAASINALFKKYKLDRRDLFDDDEANEILFDPETVHAIVAELQRLDLIDVKPDTLSLAFQIFRSANLKNGEGQYFTPARVVKAATRMMCIDPTDKVIDPACGTGGFLGEAYLQVSSQINEANAVRWANARLYGVDLDDINVKLARALMVGMGDGSTHIKLGDSIRQSKWRSNRHGLEDALDDDGYDVVLTNPPFGQNLTVSTAEASACGYSICKHTKSGKSADEYMQTEIGIVFVERAYRLLHEGGRLGIVLPETYFFSKSYSWFREWLDEHFMLKGVLNIPMEAFQGFCRAKTNFYVFSKKCGGKEPPIEKQAYWSCGGKTWISNAPTIGINKDGETLYRIDPLSMTRTDEIDDVAASDVDCLLCDDGETSTASFVTSTPLAESFIGVPQYCDLSIQKALRTWTSERLPSCQLMSLGELKDLGWLSVRQGHGSPSLDLRSGDIPYIKVSDIRSGTVNPNSTNMVSDVIAEKFWKGSVSGLKPWDVITPARASKNIGEPAIILPGQERAVFTKEVLVFRATDLAAFDNFYIAWALMLEPVNAQWERVVFMQTNREDLGDRWREILIPVPSGREQSDSLSCATKDYYKGLAKLRTDFQKNLSTWK